ncbi:MAG: transporter substrate-binding domain-containing protein [Candidatus Hydrogenedentes bacterium]|nr:transporter substrate-binding domain-containing protein [Candidatus Hydrogenedentota bacterium]
MKLTFALLSILLALLSGCGGSPADNGASAVPKPLLVGMELAYPPFETTDTAGAPTGISVDLAHALGAHLGRAVSIENTPFDGLIPALKTGRIDCIISSMTATEERASSIDFSEPYLKIGLAVLARSQGPVATPEDLAKPGVKIAVKLATTGHVYAQEHLPQAELLVLNKESACVLEVVQGKADAFIYDQLSVYRHWSEHQEACVALLKPLRVEQWAIGIRKGNVELTTGINAFLAAYREQGGFDALAEKYLATEKAFFAAQGQPFVF